MRARAAAVAAIVVASFVAPAPASPAPSNPPMPVPVTGPDPALTTGLDTVVGMSPDDTCVAVSVDGTEVYAHRADDLQTPASTQKLLTSATAFDQLDVAAPFTTRLVTSAPVTDGVLRGDLYVVGGGDPSLTSSFYATVRGIPEDRPDTSLDALAQAVADRGITRIEGRVIGDESRYDAVRTVPSWPSRFVAQEQSGPLSALTVDDGYVLELGDDGFERVRSADPPTDAARALAAVLGSRGVTVVGGAASGPAPADATEVAAIDSAPMETLIADLLQRSDNQSAELLAKELGRAAGAGGSTEAGARQVAGWMTTEQVAAEGAFVADGSGLDPTNALSCHQLVDVLTVTGGLDGSLGARLPVAGESGTLSGRFAEGQAAGRLRAKTGRLNGVSSLAGFVELPDGGVATFAYIANGQREGADPIRAQAFLAEILATYEPPCPAGPTPSILVAGAAEQAARLGAVVAAPAAMGFPVLIQTMDALGTDTGALLDRCAAAAGVRVVVAQS